MEHPSEIRASKKQIEELIKEERKMRKKAASWKDTGNDHMERLLTHRADGITAEIRTMRNNLLQSWGL